MIERSFLDFSSLIDVIGEIPEIIDDLSPFEKLCFKINNNEVIIDFEQFEKTESDFKFLRDFSSIRHKNSIKKYNDTEKTD